MGVAYSTRNYYSGPVPPVPSLGMGIGLGWSGNPLPGQYQAMYVSFRPFYYAWASHEDWTSRSVFTSPKSLDNARDLSVVFMVSTNQAKD